MTFIEALKTGRPMRRKSMSASWNGPWLVLGYDGPNETVGTPRWREMDSGKAIGLRRYEYTAEDWEVMP